MHPARKKIFIVITSLVAACYFPFGRAYGAPNFNTAGAALDQYGRVDGNSDYLSVVSLRDWRVYFRARYRIVAPPGDHTVNAVAEMGHDGRDFCVGSYFIGPVQNHFHGFEFRLYDTGVPVLRFVRDVAVNNYEVVKEQENMAQLSRMKDTGMCWRSNRNTIPMLS